MLLFLHFFWCQQKANLKLNIYTNTFFVIIRNNFCFIFSFFCLHFLLICLCYGMRLEMCWFWIIIWCEFDVLQWSSGPSYVDRKAYGSRRELQKLWCQTWLGLRVCNWRDAEIQRRQSDPGAGFGNRKRRHERNHVV